MASETTTSDRRTRAGGEIDGLVEANGEVLATPREETAQEHGGDVFGWWPWAEMGGSVCGRGWREWGNPPM